MYIRFNVSRRHGRVLTDEQSPLRIHCNLDWLGAKGRPTPPVPTCAGLVGCSDLRSGPLPRLRWPHTLCTMPCPALAWGGASNGRDRAMPIERSLEVKTAIPVLGQGVLVLQRHVR